MLSLSDSASDWINKLINRDGQFRDISIKTNYNFGDVAGVSGFSDFDYTASNLHVGGELEFEKCTALPSELLEKFAGLRQCCCMGVFPNCGKAWLTVDNEFFIWNFDDGEDLAFYDGCEDVIISVSLLRPKQGILPPQIEYLLGLATSRELLLLGVTYDFSTSTDDRVNPGVLQVLPTPLYRLPSENHRITCMESTSDGRLFLGDAKGDLLEFTYDSIPGLEIGFELPSSGPCNLKNHSSSSLSFLLPSIFTVGFCPSGSSEQFDFFDNRSHLAVSSNTFWPPFLLYTVGALTQLAVDSSRGLLYTLSANSNLALYQYADPHGKSSSGCLTKLASLSGSDLASRAASVVRSFDKQAFSRLVGLFCLTGEGPIQAMAVTHTGVRIYFSNNLRIAHIRLPPRTQASFDYENGVPKNVMASFCLGEVKSALANSLLFHRLVAETRGTLIIASTVSKPTGAGSSASTGAASSEQSFCGPQPLTATQEAQVASDGQNLVLSIISPDTYPWSTSLTEAYATSLPILSPWAITVLSCDDDTASSSTPSLPPEATSGVSKSSFNRRGIDLPHEMSSLSPEEQQTQQPQLRARGPPPVVLTQHLDPPYRRVLVISADGITHLRLPSPLQRLREFLLIHLGTTLSSSLMGGGVAPGGFDGGGDALNTTATSFLPNFLHQFGPDESMCAAFSIAADAYRTCLDDSTQTSGFGGLVEQAERAGYLLGDFFDVRNGPSGVELLVFWPSINSTLALLGYPSARKSSGMQFGHSYFLSGADYEAFKLYVRSCLILYPLLSPSTAQITSRLSTEDLGWILHQLHYLKDFLSRQLTSRNSWLRSGTTTLATLPSGKLWSPPDIRASAGSGLCRLAQDLLSLVSAFIEFVGLWQIVSQHPVPSIVRRLTPDQRADLLSLPVEAFVCWMPPAAFPPSLPSPAVARDASIFCSPSLRQQQYQQTGQGQPQLSSPSPPPPPPPPPRTNVQDLRSSLITALMEHYLSADEPHEATTGTPASVDALSARLRAVCPNLFANEDALCAKAEELLVRACAAATAAVGGPATAENALPPPLPPTVDQLVLEAAELFAEAGPSINVGLAAQRLLNSVGAWQVAASLCLSVAQNRDPTDIAVTCLREGRMPSPLADGSSPVLCCVLHSYDAYRHLLNCLDRLLVAAALPAAASEIPESPSSPSSTQSSQLALGPNPSASAARTCLLTILKSIVKSEDTLAHFEVIGWLLSNGLIEQVVTLNSTHLEAYLRSRLRQTPNDVSLRCLLWRQLEARGAHLEAARVLEHLASAPSGGLELEDRLDYLARAIITVKALPRELKYAEVFYTVSPFAGLSEPLTNGPQTNQQDPDYLCDLQDRLETAELQRQLCVELAAFGCPDQQKHCKGVETTGLEEAIHELTHGPLLSLSDLFTRYADPFDLHESKLLLLRFAGEADSDLVRAIWLALLHRLLVSAPESQSSPANRSSRSPRQRLAEGSVRRSELTLSTALFRLYTRLAAPAGPTLAVDYSFFPLPVIISTLERYAIQLSLPATWVSCVLSSARIPPSAEIVEAYNIILCDKV
ncbi:unnamed protein product [Schistocephalus solidus]|uniref:Uncharacterized protein n=1 Tax=Schistocephalus solidus TaxID=70667 RepID=A0A3P7C3N4_SCHSO|nr:unnamed protein product [Schistocephalus solidus]